MMVNLSANEVASLTKLATRGAGYTWGLCEEAAAAGRWLTLHELPAGDIFATLCQRVDGQSLDRFTPVISDQDWVSQGACLCPLICGAALTDRAGELSGNFRLTLHDVFIPLLLVPFASQLSTDVDMPIRLSWNNVEIECRNEQTTANIAVTELKIPLTGDVAPATITLTTQCDSGHCSESWRIQSSARPELSAERIEQLNQFAHRTYAPDTEQSRQRGAGAGTNDND